MFCSFNFFENFFFSGAYLACFSSIYVFCGWVKIIKGWCGLSWLSEDDSCPSQHSLSIHFKWSMQCSTVIPNQSFELSGTHFAGKTHKDFLISGPKHLSEFKFTSHCRFKLLVQSVWFAETSLNHDQENTKTSFVFLFSPIFEAAN